MSADVNTNHSGNGNENSLASRLDQVMKISLFVAGVGVGLLVLGALLFGVGQAIRSYYMGYLFWLGLPLGCASLLLLNHLAGGTWGLVIRRPLEAGAATIPVMTLLFLPIALGLGQIYPWAEAEFGDHHQAVSSEAEEEETKGSTENVEPEATFAPEEVTESGGGEPAAFGHKELWFSRPFFFGRVVFYFLIWNLFAFLLIRWSDEQDKTDDPAAPTRRLGLIGAPGLILLFLTGTFAMFDWVMSLEPEWYSTIFGAMMITGMGLQTFAAIIFITSLLADRGELEDLPTPARLRDLGNLMLAFVMLWAYTAFSQFLLIWSGNLAEEIPWYLKRTAGGWQVVAACLIVFHFFLPFMVLLFRENKERTGRLRLIAGAIFVIHLIDIFWLTAPSIGYPHPVPSLLDPAAVLGVGGLWVAAYAFFLKRRPLVPRNDPDLAALREHEQQHHHSPAGGA